MKHRTSEIYRPTAERSFTLFPISRRLYLKKLAYNWENHISERSLIFIPWKLIKYEKQTFEINSVSYNKQLWLYRHKKIAFYSSACVASSFCCHVTQKCCHGNDSAFHFYKRFRSSERVQQVCSDKIKIFT